MRRGGGCGWIGHEAVVAVAAGAETAYLYTYGEGCVMYAVVWAMGFVTDEEMERC